MEASVIAFRLILSISFALFVAQPSLAQPAGAESIFRSQLVELHSKAVAILDRVEKRLPQGPQEIQTREEIFALVRLVHRLEEEAAATNLQSLQRGQPQNKALLLVTQAAKGVDAMLAALDNYIASADRSFLGFARDNNAIVWAVRKVM
jgi:hypothetical protein